MAKMKTLHMVSWILCTIAALQLGILGLFSYDVLGMLGAATRVLYVLIGIGGVYSASHIFMMKK